MSRGQYDYARKRGRKDSNEPFPGFITCTYRVGLLYPDPDYPILDSTDPSREWLEPTLAMYQAHKLQVCQAGVADERTERLNRIARKQRIRPYKDAIADRVLDMCIAVTNKCRDNIDHAIDLFHDKVVSGEGVIAAGYLSNHFPGKRGKLGDKSNLYQAAYLAMVGETKNYLDREQKLADVKELFKQRPAKWYEFLFFARSPFTETWLAAKWNVSRYFTKRFLTSLRNKLDPFLFQAYQFKQPFPVHAITVPVLATACDRLIVKVRQTIADLQQAGGNNKPSKAFLKKLQTIKHHAAEVVDYFHAYPFTTGWKPLRQRAHELVAGSEDSPKILPGRASNYHSALRAVLSLAVVDFLQQDATLAVTFQGPGVDVMTPERCLSKPFQSSRARKSLKPLPLPLVMGPKYVIQRPGNKKKMTTLLRDNHLVRLNFPKCKIKVERTTKRGKRKQVTKNRTLHAFVPASRKIIRSLQRGATVELLRVLPPTGPSRKVQIEVVLSGPSKAFVSTKHLNLEQYCDHCWLKLPVPLVTNKKNLQPSTTIVCPRCKKSIASRLLPLQTHQGVDINRLGPHAMSFDTGEQLSPASQLSRTTLATIGHYYQQKEHLRALDEQKAAARQQKNWKKRVNLGRQRKLVHGKITRLRKASHELCEVDLSIQLAKTGVTTLACEQLAGLDAAGKKGARAKAILNMPDDVTILVRGVWNVTAWHHEQGRQVEVIIDPQDPRHTSSTHTGCGGKLLRSPGQWDMAPCKKCGKKVNTHVNAAQAVKLLSMGLPLTTNPFTGSLTGGYYDFPADVFASAR
jgi:hypothetical protein